MYCRDCLEFYRKTTSYKNNFAMLRINLRGSIPHFSMDKELTNASN